MKLLKSDIIFASWLVFKLVIDSLALIYIIWRLSNLANAEEAQWKAEGDANTLAEADIILNDDKRLKAAQKAAKNMAKDMADRLTGLLKVAGKLNDKVEGMKIINRT